MEDFETLYKSYYPEVYRYLLRLCGDASLAEEATQEAFFRALRSIRSYREDCRFSVWVCAIARNTLYDELKRRRRMTGSDVLEALTAPEDVEAAADDRDLVQRIRAILESLPEPYRGVFRMRTYGEMPFAQIAAHFGKTESWARVTYHRAKMKIEEGLQ